MPKQSSARHDSGQLPTALLGQPARIMERHRGDLLALTYLLGDIGVLGGWAADPHDVSNRAGMAALAAFVMVAASVMFVLRRRLPVWVGDMAIVGSLVLIDAANLFTRIGLNPALFMPYYLWVGFTAPMWFPRRRAAFYVVLAAVASGIVVIVADSGEALAAWIITMVTMVVAFVTVSFLTDALLRNERLAAVGVMASALSHDLRTPLTAVTNSIYLVRVGIGEDDAQRLERHFDMADRQISKAAAIAQHLVNFVRPHEPMLEQVDLGQLVAEVIEALPAPDGITVSIEHPAVVVSADGGQLTQVVSNLVSNAYDAMGGGGTLHLAVSADDRSAVITVEDSGPGLDKAVAERAFEPFFTTKHAGTGLGLAIVRQLTEAHGGTVTVDSKPGRGTRFVIRLPRAPAGRSLRRLRT